MIAGKVAVNVELIYICVSVTDTQGPSGADDHEVGRFHHTGNIGADWVLRVVLVERNPKVHAVLARG